MHSRLAQGTAVLLFGIALISCKQSLDLSEVSTLAKTVASGQDALQAIPADFYDSCVRQITWSRAAALGLNSPPVKLNDVAGSLPPNAQTLLAESPPSASSAALEAVFNVTTACAKHHAASEQMAVVTTTLTSYFAAIGKLAAIGMTTGIGFDKLGAAMTALDPTSVFNKSGKTAAVASGLDALASGTIARRAKSDLGPDILAANTLVGRLIDRLISDKSGKDEDNVAGYYLSQLTYERFAMHSFYSNNIGLKPVGIARFRAFGYYQKEAAEDAKIDQRVAAVQTYRSTLSKIKSAHADLAKAVAANDFASAVKIAQQYAALVQPQINKLRSAFK